MPTVACPPAPTLNKEEELHWLALKLVPGLGTRRSWKILERYRTPMAIFRASRSELEAAGLSGSVAHSIVSGCAFDGAVDEQQRLLDSRAVLIAIKDPPHSPRVRH